MVKISRNKMILSRIQKLKKRIKIDTQRMRGKTLNTLEELFEMAKDLAQNTNLKLKQRQMWTRIAAYICQVINSVASGFDERQTDVQLDQLEDLINEARSKTKTKKTKRPYAGAKKDKASKGPC